MQIYFVGSEYDSVNSTEFGINSFESGSIQQDWFVRGGIAVRRGAHIPMPFGQSVSKLWVHFRCRPNHYAESDKLVVFYGEDGDVLRISIKSNNGADNALWKYQSWDATNSLWVDVAGTNFSLQRAATVTHDVHISATGAIEHYVNDILVASTEPSAIVPTPLLGVNFFSSTPTNSDDTVYVELLAANSCTVGHRVIRTYGQNEGTYTEWAGNHQAVDEFGGEETDAISSDTGGAIESFTVRSLPDWGMPIKAYVVALRGRRDPDGNISGVTPFVRVAGTNYFSGGLNLTTASYAYKTMWVTNPATGNPWNISLINSAEIGVRAEEFE